MPRAAAIGGALLALVSACGGGSTSGTPSAAPDPDPTTEPLPTTGVTPEGEPEAADGPLHGVLWLERRGDKLTADAWFAAAPGADDASPDDGDGPCRVEILSPSEGASPAIPLRGAAERIVVGSRGAEQLVLEPQRLGDTVVYASEARWLREPLAADARVLVEDVDGETLFDALAITALPEPTLESPASGRLGSLAEPVLWSAAPEAGTRVRVALSGVVDGEDRRIDCLVPDEGRLELPPALRGPQADAPGWTLSLARERRVRTARGDDTFEIVQRVLF